MRQIDKAAFLLAEAGLLQPIHQTYGAIPKDDIAKLQYRLTFPGLRLVHFFI